MSLPLQLGFPGLAVTSSHFLTFLGGDSSNGFMSGGRMAGDKYFGIPSLDILPMWLPGSTLGVTMAERGGAMSFISLSMAWS